jgi:hypothetical protein
VSRGPDGHALHPVESRDVVYDLDGERVVRT